MTGKAGVFGPGVIGQEQFDAEKETVAVGADVFGPLVTGKGVASTPASVAAPEKPVALPAGIKAAAPASIADVEDLLEKNPAAFDILFAAELERPEGPRKGALRLFKAAEEGQGPAVRTDILAKIAEALGE